jgi:transcriptional regulator with XRE-family HTH domain
LFVQPVRWRPPHVEADRAKQLDKKGNMLRTRDVNDRWARYVDILIARRYNGRQAAFARELSVSPSTVSRWLDGSSPEIDHVRAVSAASGVPLRELLTEAFQLTPAELASESDSAAQGTLAESHPDADLAALADSWPWLLNGDRAAVRHLVQRIAGQSRQSNRRAARRTTPRTPGE